VRDDEKRDAELLRSLLSRWSAEDVLKKQQTVKRQPDARKQRRIKRKRYYKR